MKMKNALTVIIVYLLFFAGNVNGAKPKDNWAAHPQTTILSLWEFTVSKNDNKKITKGEYLGRLISTDSLSWPDGRQALVTYFEVTESLWRCVEYFDSAMVKTGEMCYRLEK